MATRGPMPQPPLLIHSRAGKRVAAGRCEGRGRHHLSRPAQNEPVELDWAELQSGKVKRHFVDQTDALQPLNGHSGNASYGSGDWLA